MNRTIHFARICFKTSMAIAILCGSTLSLSHDTTETQSNSGRLDSESADHSRIKIEPYITKQKARKLTRQFLTRRGFTRQIAPGGAHIRNISSKQGFWLVELSLRNTSAANITREMIFINKRSGELIEYIPDQLRLAEIAQK